MRRFVSALLLILVSCAPKNTAKAPAVAPLAAIQWADLGSAPYTLAVLNLNRQDVPLPAEGRPTIQFGADSRVSGNSGVNRYSAGAALAGKNGFAWTSPMISTKMAGRPAAMALETSFLQALQSVTRIEAKNGMLLLVNSDGVTRLEFRR